MNNFKGYEKGMGIGGWLTNYKRLAQLPEERRMKLTIGDFEHFDTYITEEDVKNIASFGMDHIRLCFDQIVLEDYDKPYTYRDETFRHIDDFLVWAEKYNLNVVLNLHKAIGCYCEWAGSRSLLDEEELRDRFVALWLEFEKRYHNIGGRIAFELMNEVTSKDSTNWNSLAARTIAEIRKLNPERKIVLGCAYWNTVTYLKDLDLYDDDNIMYTFHFYNPHEFTHQRGVLQPLLHYCNRQMYYPYEAKPYIECRKLYGGDPAEFMTGDVDKKWIWEHLMPAAEFVKAHPDKVLYLGEFGVIRHTDFASREHYFADIIEFCIKYGIHYSVWNYLSCPYDGNRFSLVDDDYRKIIDTKLLDIFNGRI